MGKPLGAIADIHEEVLNTDFALTRLFVRKAFVQLLASIRTQSVMSEDSPSINMRSNEMMLNDIDLENVIFISNDHLAFDDVSGNILSNNLSTLEPASKIWSSRCGKSTDLFYEEDQDLKQELKRILKIGSKDQLSSFVEELFASVTFTKEVIPVNDFTAVSSTVTFKDAAFVIATPRFSSAAAVPKDLKILVQVLDGAEVSRSGQLKPKTVLSYPVKSKDPFPSLILTSDTVRVVSSGGAESDASVELVGVPKEMPILLALAELIMTDDCHDSKLKEAQALILTNLMDMIRTLDLPIIMKEFIFKVDKVKGLECHVNELNLIKDQAESNYFKSLFNLIRNIDEHVRDDACTDKFKQLDTFLDNCGQFDSILADRLQASSHQRLIILSCIPDHISVQDIQDVTKPHAIQMLHPHDDDSKPVIILETQFSRQREKMIKELQGLDQLSPAKVFSLNKSFSTGDQLLDNVIEQYLHRRLEDNSKELEQVLTQIYTRSQEDQHNGLTKRQLCRRRRFGRDVTDFILATGTDEDILENVMDRFGEMEVILCFSIQPNTEV